MIQQLKDFGYTGDLVIEHEMACMYLDCIYDPLSMGHTLIRIGKQSPLYAVSSGKILLTEMSQRDIDRMIEEKGFVALTSRTIASREQLMAELEKVREQGYAVDDEECELGLRCVAVPIRDYSGKVVAAISSFGPVEAMSREHIETTVIPALRAAADELSLRMGGRCPFELEA